MKHLLPVLLLPLLTGCPLLTGGPDLPDKTTTPSGTVVGVPDTDTDTDTDSDTDTDTDTDTDSGTLPTGTQTGVPTGTPTGVPTGVTTTPPGAPLVTGITSSWFYGETELRIVIDDPDDDLVGGAILVDDGTLQTLFSIPGDLIFWDALGIATLRMPTGVPCGGLNLNYTVQVTDNQANPSPLAFEPLVVLGVTHLEGVDPTVVGNLQPPAIVCGDLQNNSDVDETTFLPLATAPWTITLHDLAVPFEDRDMELLGTGGAVVASAVSANDPDSINYTLAAAQTYTLRVFAAGGGPGSDWSIAIHQ